MPKRPDLPCAVCGRMLWRGTTSLPDGMATCRPCRRLKYRRRCAWCGDCLEVRGANYCSRPCASAARQTRCEICRAPFRGHGRTQRTCSRACGLELSYRNGRTRAIKVRRIWPKNCETCGSLYVARNIRSRFCSPTCAPAAPYTYTPTVSVVACRECGTEFSTTRGKTAKYCGARCARRCANRQRRHKERTRLVEKSTPMRTEWTPLSECAECGTALTGRPKRYCSQPCGDRARDRQARHRARTGLAQPADLITIHMLGERDNWRCHICRHKVERAFATIDHLVPVSLGGLHVWMNVALACAHCNSTRGNRGSIQMMLM